jgi:hypothetical protein
MNIAVEVGVLRFGFGRENFVLSLRRRHVGSLEYLPLIF